MMLGADHIFMHSQSLPPAGPVRREFVLNPTLTVVSHDRISLALTTVAHARVMSEAADMSWVKPGAKCVCIDDHLDPVKFPCLPPIIDDRSVMPVRGRVYTVQASEWYTYDHPILGRQDFLGVHLLEIQRPRGGFSGRLVPYRANRFRPLVSRSAEDDAALFAPLVGDSVEEPA